MLPVTEQLIIVTPNVIPDLSIPASFAQIYLNGAALLPGLSSNGALTFIPPVSWDWDSTLAGYSITPSDSVEAWYMYASQGVPDVPQNLIAVAGGAAGEIDLSWDASTLALNYNVYRATVTGGPYTKVGNQILLTTFTDTGLTTGTVYYYTVSAVSDGGESNPSNEASATAP